MPLPSPEDPLDPSGVLAVVRQLARRLGHLPNPEDYDRWAERRAEHRPGMLRASELVASAGAADWDELCERVARG